jgi:hypothetical protein
MLLFFDLLIEVKELNMPILVIKLSIWEKELIKKLSSERSYDVSKYTRLILIGFDPNSIVINFQPSRARFICNEQGLSRLMKDSNRYSITKNKAVYPKKLIEQLNFELNELKKSVLKEENADENINAHKIHGDSEMTTMSIRFLVSEMEKIKRDATAQRLSNNQFIRNCLNNRRLPNQLSGVNEKINQDLSLLRSELIQGTCNIPEWVQVLRSWHV